MGRYIKLRLLGNRPGARTPSKCQVALGRAANWAVERLEGRVLLSGSLLTDIDPRTASSAPAEFAQVGSSVFFSALVPATNWYGIYRTDGTAAGTSLAYNVTATNFWPSHLTSFNGGVLFYDFGKIQRFDPATNTATALKTVSAANDGVPFARLPDGTGVVFNGSDSTGGGELWRSDGTPAGTVRVADIYAGTGESYPSTMTVAGNLVYFTATEPSGGRELWKTDGTASGTSRVKDIAPGGADSVPLFWTSAGGSSTLYFVANDGSTGNELWRTDGTSANTQIVKDLTPGGGSSSISNLTTIGNRAYFTTSDGTLWASDGTSATTQAVGTYAAPSGLTAYGGALYFATGDGKLWRTDGTTGGTTIVHASLGHSNLKAANGKLYFDSSDSTTGTELWVSDGTFAGTSLVKDLAAGAAGSTPVILGSAASGVYFTADDGVHGLEPFVTNGTSAGTTLLGDLNPKPFSSSPSKLFKFRDNIFFEATVGLQGKSLVRSDGTPEGTISVLNTAIDSAMAVGNQIFFVNGNTVYRTNGDPESVEPVKTFTTGTPVLRGDVGGRLAFTNERSTLGPELWFTDGTQPGTVMVHDFAGPVASLQGFATIGSRLFFYANDGFHGYEPWISDGTSAGTVMLRDIRPGSVGSAFVAGNPGVAPIVNNGSLYFAADDGTANGLDLWKTDGTAANTVFVKDTNAVTYSRTADPHPFVIANGVVMWANDGNNEVWRSDGTAAGTYPVYTYDFRTFVKAPAALVSDGARAWFSDKFHTDAYYAGLWQSDGTVAGTRLVQQFQLRDPSGDPGLGPITAFDGIATFTAYNYPAGGGTAPWRSDGTTAGTVQITTDQMLPVGSVVASGDHFFAGTDSVHGTELWEIPGPLPALPATPTNFVASTFSADRIDLTWNDIATNESSYRIERSSTSTFDFIDHSWILMPGTTSYSDNGLTAGDTFYYRLAARNDAGFSAKVTSFNTTTGALPAPTNLVLTPLGGADSGHEVGVSWTDNAITETGYVLERSNAPTFRTVDLTVTLPANTTAYTDTGLVPQTLYYYRLRAVTGAGRSQALVGSVTTLDTVPIAPSGFIAFGITPTTIELQWADNSQNEQGFAIERAEDGQSFAQIATMGGNTLHFDDVPPRSDVPYHYRVRAYGSAGASAYSNESAATDLPPQLSNLVVDLNTTPVASANSDPSPIVTVNGIGYFAATEEDAGRELWRTDGTAAGTARLIDLMPGAGSADPQQITAIGNTIYFTAVDSSHGRELWSSDGTAAGTILVSDILPGAGDSVISGLTDVGGIAYFTADDGAHGSELWSSDGTIVGTHLVSDINSGPAGTPIDRLFAAGGKLYFSTTVDATGTELWTSDGTASGTKIVADLAPGAASSTPLPLAVLGGALLFSADTPGAGRELWITDATTAGAHLVTDISAGAAASSPGSTAVLNGVAYFFADDGTHGRELWRSDGTSAGTQLVKDLVSGGAPTVALDPVVSGGGIYYATLDGVNGPVTLWRSDGTTGGTIALKQVVTGPVTSPGIAEGVNVNGIFYFTTTQWSDRLLWRSDGTAANTQPVAGTAGDGSGNPHGLAAVGTNLLFDGSDSAAGREVWVSNSGTGATSRLKDINVHTADANPQWLTSYNGSVYFDVPGPDSVGGDLWRVTDGVAVKFMTGYASYLTVANGLLFFVRSDTSGATALWVTDGTTANTRMLMNAPGSDRGPQNFGGLVVAGNLVFFETGRQLVPSTLWRSDGTTAGTFQLDGVNVGDDDAAEINSGLMTAMDGVLYFRGSSTAAPITGKELWRSDGTNAGTQLVKDLYATDYKSSSPFYLTAVNHTLFFAAKLPVAGYELFKSDGTAGGTVLVKSIYNGQSAPPLSHLTAAGNRLIFSANDPSNGYELWSSDGTDAGTTQVKDLNAGIQGSGPSQFVTIGSKVFFVAADNVDQGRYGLWTSDGTATGTIRLRSVVGPQYGNSIPFDMVAANGTLFFIDNRYLWRSDGTPSGTVQVMQASSFETADPFTLGPRWAALGDQLYLAAYEPVHGRELWTVSTTLPTAPIDLTASGSGSVIAPGGKGGSVAAVTSGGGGGATRSVTLRWTDKSSTESGFIIERSTTSNFSVIETSYFAPVNATSFVDPTAPAAGQRYYRVRAVNAKGTSAYTNTVAPVVSTTAIIVSRKLFYNNSKFDGASIAANASDDAAIATEKLPLLPGGGKGTFANVSAYDKGINGVMFDISGLPSGTALTGADFSVDVSTDGTTWTGSTLPGVTIRRGAGGSAYDRVTLIWPDNSIKNKWLRLTMKATAATGLAKPDISYWGSAVGDTGNGLTADTTVNVDSSDYYGVRDHLRSYDNPNPVTWKWDINRDGVTDLTDIMLVRSSATTSSTALRLITAAQPAAPVQIGGGLQTGGGTTKPVQTTPTPASTPTPAPASTPTSTPAGSTTTPASPKPVVQLPMKRRISGRPLNWGTR